MAELEVWVVERRWVRSDLGSEIWSIHAHREEAQREMVTAQRVSAGSVHPCGVHLVRYTAAQRGGNEGSSK